MQSLTPAFFNIVLIGMPGAGKSTVGVILAKQALMEFVDTDLLIQTAEQRTLQEIVDHDGYLALRRIEEELLLRLTLRNTVIATGGSAVYSDRAMAHLKEGGLTVFLDVSLSVLETRIHDYATRGLARRPDQDLADLFRERHSLYTTYADLTIRGDLLTQEEVCAEIMARTRLLRPAAR